MDEVNLFLLQCINCASRQHQGLAGLQKGVPRVKEPLAPPQSKPFKIQHSTDLQTPLLSHLYSLYWLTKVPVLPQTLAPDPS